MAEHRVSVLNHLVDVKCNSLFDYNLSIEHIQMDLAFYKSSLARQLPKKMRGYAYLPIELFEPLSSQIRLITLCSIRFELIKTLPKFLKEDTVECINHLSSAIVKNLNINNSAEADLLLDFARSIKVFDSVFQKVMNTLIAKDHYQEALYIISLLSSCSSFATFKHKLQSLKDTLMTLNKKPVLPKKQLTADKWNSVNRKSKFVTLHNLVTKSKEDYSLPPETLLQNIKNSKEGVLRNQYFEKFYEYAILRNNLDKAIDLITSLTDTTFKDNVLMMLWKKLNADTKWKGRNENTDYAKAIIASSLSDQSRLG
jgi:hypothetical protein